ncbi:MAG: DMT family transporter [Thermodesulfobacteriota bacterium]
MSVIFVNLLWGVSNVTVKTLLGYVPPLMLAGWRFSLGSVLFLVFMKLGGHSFPNKGCRLIKLALLGLVQTTLLQAFFFIGLSLTSVGKASVFMNSQPL